MSHGTENPLTVKARNARPDRKVLRQAQGNLYRSVNLEKAAAYTKTAHENEKKKKELMGKWPGGTYAQLIQTAFNPISVESDNCIFASDWHFPFVDPVLFNILLDIRRDYDIKDLFVPGDLWDADDYSRFIDSTPKTVPIKKQFSAECEEVEKGLRILYREFEKIYICKGNHEDRWISLNGGKMTMRNLYKEAIPGNINANTFFEKVKITDDNYIYVYQRDQKWLFCHPVNFRKLNLSVVRDLAAKYECNVIGGHGHQWAQGYDVSGKYQICDGGGLFDKHALAYLRRVSCHPETKGGFYTLIDGILTPYEGK